MAEASFRYMARNRTGQAVSGLIRGENREEVARRLREQALFPVKIEPAPVGVALGFGFGKGVSARALARFYSQMSDLLHSGVPLLRCLDVLQRQSSTPRLTEILADIRKKVADGVTLADAMGAHEQIFGELAVSMVRAGQEGGFLEDVFRRIGLFTDRQEDLKGKVVGALAYPVLLAIIGSGILFILFIFFIPKFAKVFDRLRERGELPAVTEALLNISQYLQSYWYLAIVIVFGVSILIQRRISTPAGRRALDSVKLKIPFLGVVIRDLAITRFNRVLGTLRRNGIPILTSLRIAKDSTGNVLMKEAIDQAAENIKAGDKLATPLRLSNCFPMDIVEMIEVAEESNNLENVLLESADSLETLTTRKLDLAVRMLEPLMLLVMASVTLLVVVALLLPIFKMSSAL